MAWATDEPTFEAAMQEARHGRIVAPARHLTGEQVARLVALLPREQGGAGPPCAQAVDLAGTTIVGDCDLSEVSFAGPASFARAAFEGVVAFTGATFAERTSFEETSFYGRTSFWRARFAQPVDFDCALFDADADFGEGRFGGEVRFDGVTFDRDASFVQAELFSRCSFTDVVCKGEWHFYGAQVHGALDLRNARFGRDASFAGAWFGATRALGPLSAAIELTLDDTTFDEHVRVEAIVPAVWFNGATFRAGVDLFTSSAALTAERTDFGGPSLVTALPTERRTALTHLVSANRRAELLDGPFEPSVASLYGAKVAQLTLSRVDLSECRFAGAHGLDSLRLERVRLARTPSRWRLWRRPPRWTARRTIAEERDWRLARGYGAGWASPPASLPKVARAARDDALEADQVAALYRALRKGFEDQKDAPGAADFYYGEMEMRRMYGSADRRIGMQGFSRVRPLRDSERLILWLYWVVAGYGLRASRAFIALALTITLLAIPLVLWGFQPPRGYGRAVLFAAESSISLLRVPRTSLTVTGEVIQLVLRLAGPLFFGLAVLALRGRVKR